MRIHRGRAAALLGCGVLLTGVAIVVNQRGKPWSGPIPTAAPADPAPAARLPVTITVSAQGLARPDGLLEAGIPLPPGVVTPETSLRITRDGAPLPATFEPLALDPDGSVRWIRLTLPLRLEATETATLELGLGAATPPPAVETAAPPLTLRLRSDRGSAEVQLPRARCAAWTREDEGTGAGCEVDVEPLTASRVRVRLRVVQRRGAGTWQALTLTVDDPAWRGVVDADDGQVRAVDVGAVTALIAAPLPADPGEGRSWELTLERRPALGDLRQRVARPLRAQLPPGYVAETGAFGRLGPSAPIAERLAAAATELSTTRLDDAATPLLLLHATSDHDGLSAARTAARRAAQALALNGGSYGDGTSAAIERVIARAMVEAVIDRWRSKPDTPADDATIVAFVRERYGPKAQRTTTAVLTELGRLTGAERERRAALLLCSDLLARVVGRLTVTAPQQVADALLASKELERFSLTRGRDELFAPFFARYGGSWEAFPVLARVDRPRDRDTHRGADAQVGGLVWTHLWTGDPSLRRAALRAARYHVEDLVPREVRRLEAERAQGGKLEPRQLGWPLLNLLDLAVLTAGRELELHKRVQQSQWSLVAALNAVRPERYAAPLDVGVCGEALARYHERTGDDAARRTLIRLYRWWCSRGWTPTGFRAGEAVRGLSAYGLCYAAWQADDARLAGRARTLLTWLEAPSEEPTRALRFRNALRATPLRSRLPQAPSDP